MVYKVDLVLVTFFPDRDLLKKSLLSLVHQVRRVILISNHDDDFSDFGLDLIHINLKENKGIAAAQNLGIKKALSDEADFILTSDQDTVFPQNYVKEILQAYQNLINHGAIIGAVSPVFRDAQHANKMHPIVKFGRFGLKKFPPGKDPQKVSHVISSGMLLNAKSLIEVGLMKEPFFIDWVDTEWCWRADALGYSIYQIPEISISHALGENSKDLILFSVTSHHYLREYYKLRNAIFLLKDRHYRQLNRMIYLSLFIIKNTLINSLKAWKDIRYLQVVKNSFKHGIRQEEGEFRF